MKFLLDTNIFIPLEPGSIDDIEASTNPAMELARICNEQGVQLFLHPETITDINHDRNEDRRALRKTLANRYIFLVNPPPISSEISALLGEVDEDSNDWVDHNLIAAVHSGSVDFLITEDINIHKKAARLKLSEHVLTIADAIAFLKSLFDKSPPPPPEVRSLFAYELDDSDPIFDSLRRDYNQFNDWFRKCKLEHRTSWVVMRNSGGYACVCIVKPEKPAEYGLPGKVLKICTFKVSEDVSGFRIGELLLKTILFYSHENNYDCLYVTSFAKHVHLINLLNTFGFSIIDQETSLGEQILVKRMKPSSDEERSHDALSFNIKFGPFAVILSDTPAFVVPIAPQYHNMLFPELALQRNLFQPMEPFGNSIRKAYLCKSNIEKVTPGSNLLFYKSGGSQTVSTFGVVEEAKRLQNAEDIARHVGNRTVYSFNEIENMLSGSRGVLSILFRQSITLKYPLRYPEMNANGVLNGYPQSIVTISDEGAEWLQNRIKQ